MQSFSLISCIFMAVTVGQLGFISYWFAPPMEPNYAEIKFWDFEQERERGIRAFFYTLPKEKENRLVDARLHQKMLQYLSFMCQKVITIESFENSINQRSVETVLVELTKDWKQRGQVDRDYFFSSLPTIDVDLLVFMERSYYNHIWKRDKKYLVIGMDIAVFEMDFGNPIYTDRLMLEFPWYGERTAYERVELKAMLEGANRIGEELHAIAQMINERHQAELEAQREAELAAQREWMKQRITENKDYKELIDNAEKIFKQYDEPQDILQPMRENAALLEELIEQPIHDLSDQQITKRQQTAKEIRNQVDQLQKWREEQKRLREQQELATPPTSTQGPVVQPYQEQKPLEQEPMQPSSLDSTLKPRQKIPEVDTPPANIFDRRWLMPSEKSQTSRDASTQMSPSQQSTKPLDMERSNAQQPLPSAKIKSTTTYSIPRLSLPKQQEPSPQAVMPKLPTWMKRLNTSRLGKKLPIQED